MLKTEARPLKYVILIISFLLSTVVYTGQEELRNINQLRWENRIILIYSAGKDNDIENKGLFIKYKDQINERDLIWFIIKESEVMTNYSNKLSNEFLSNIKNRFPIEGDKVLLIGKDGDIKAKGAELNLNFIFREVDSMPMRQQEIKNSVQ
ncbi:DUF4174 domain-containing protein [Psychromonas sp. SP041]|jgi:hypothetical protein|uniref:DUF4174 domain-containing protein n=1 Tax=Psychromonas sp. SP041 TaxID=1365007 RepID=UPI000425A809|nr:DUF4174 domain-containing protein [Psychromonas sp. SP041]